MLCNILFFSYYTGNYILYENEYSHCNNILLLFQVTFLDCSREDGHGSFQAPDVMYLVPGSLVRTKVLFCCGVVHARYRVATPYFEAPGI